MVKHKISETFYYVETNDRLGRLIRTVVFRLENHIYEAFSYAPNEIEKILGCALSHNDKKAKILSIIDLENQLSLEYQRRAASSKLTTD